MPKRFGMNDVFGLGQSSIAPLVLDRLPATAGSWSFGRRKRRGWLGPVGTLYRTTDGVEIPVFGQGRWGLVGTRFVRAFTGWNRLARTEEFTDVATWQTLIAGAGVTPSRTANVATSPFGSLVADRIVLQNNSNTSSDRSGIRQSVSVVNGNSYTLSFWVRSNTSDTYQIAFHFSGGSQTLFNATPSWTRVSFTGNATTTGLAFFGLELRGPTSSTFADLLLYGAQLNDGSTADTYDPRGASPAGNALWSRLFDQSGNGRHFEQANAALMPYACRAGVPVTENGVLAGEFVASEARRMQIANSTAAFNFMHTTGGSAYIISRANNTADEKVLLNNSTFSTTAGMQFRWTSSERPRISASRRDVAGVATNGGSTDLHAINTVQIGNDLWACELDPDNATPASRARLWRNGTAVPDVNANTDPPFIENASANLTLGALSSGATPHDGTICDVDLWQGYLSTSHREIYQRDASRTYGMAIA